MSSRFKLVGGSLLGAVVIHIAFIACSASTDPPGLSADSGVIGALMDAARDVVGMETQDANAQDVPAGMCNCPAGMPSGTVVAYAGSPMAIPEGWALCDGRAVPRIGSYASLFAAIGTAHGAGDMVGTFNLPDYRGRFLRGQDLGSMRDPDRAMRAAANPGGGTGDSIGTVQDGAVGGHSHSLHRGGYGGPGFAGMGGYYFVDQSGSQEVQSGSSGARIGSETRPINVSVNYIIKI